MKLKKVYFLTAILVLIFITIGCAVHQTNRHAAISIQNEQGDVLATEADLTNASLQEEEQMGGVFIQAEF